MELPDELQRRIAMLARRTDRPAQQALLDIETRCANLQMENLRFLDKVKVILRAGVILFERTGHNAVLGDGHLLLTTARQLPTQMHKLLERIAAIEHVARSRSRTGSLSPCVVKRPHRAAQRRIADRSSPRPTQASRTKGGL